MNPELDWSNLPKNSNFWRESFAQKSGARISAPVKNFFVLFYPNFQFSIQNCIPLFLTIFFISSLVIWKLNNVCRKHFFYWYLICKTDVKKWLKTKICSFLWLIWKWKEKGTKKIDLPQRGFEPRIFEQIPAQNLNFEGD